MVLVGGAKEWLPNFVEKVKALKLGPGSDKETDMGLLIRPSAKERVCNYIEKGIALGAELLLDGRNAVVPGYEKENFVGPTIFSKVNPVIVSRTKSMSVRSV